MYLGSWKINDLLTFTAQTSTLSTGADVDADSVPTYRVYEDETGTPILTGSMAKLDDANTTGFYSEQITLSAANGFEKGKSYNVRITATVGSVVASTIRNLQIEAEVDANVVSDKTGYGLVDGAITAAKFAANAITASVIAADAITSTKVADGFLTSAKFASGAFNAVWTVATRLLTAGTNIVLAKGTGVTGFNDIAAGSAMTLTSGERDAVADAQFDRSNAIETGLTMRGALRLIAAVTAGKASGMSTTTGVFRNAVADTKARITATQDSDGNRTAVSTDVT